MSIENWLSKNTVSLVGRRIAVTGSTGGLGKELCRYLCRLGASLILMDRNAERSRAHRDSLALEFGCEVECIGVDLEDMVSVRRAAGELILRRVDVFIHNAGAYSIPRHTCESGFDNVFQINFVSPYYIIRKILPTLRERGGRVVVVGSIAHNYSKTDREDVDFATRPRASLVYGNAKRYLMFSLYELFKKETCVSLAVTHPGISFTGITAHYPKLLFAIIKNPMKIIFMKPKKAALSTLSGVFCDTGAYEWIGPRVFDVWGLPKKRRLKTVCAEEAEYIGATADKIYISMANANNDLQK